MWKPAFPRKTEENIWNVMHTNLAHLQERKCARFVCRHSSLFSICGVMLYEQLLSNNSEINNIQTVTACEMLQPQIQWLGHLQLV